MARFLGPASSGTLLGTRTYALGTGLYYYLEFTIHYTLGSFEVCVDGVNRLERPPGPERDAARGGPGRTAVPRATPYLGRGRAALIAEALQRAEGNQGVAAGILGASVACAVRTK